MYQVNIMFPMTYHFYKSSCHSCISGSKCKISSRKVQDSSNRM